MADRIPWLHRLLGPAPLIGLTMLAAGGLSILSAFRITPVLPAGSGWAALGGLLLLANGYVLVQVAALWPKLVGAGGRSFRLASTPGASSGDAMAELRGMVGLDGVRQEIETLVARLTVETARREAGMTVAPVSLHMVFAGPPGVGKTVVARLYGTILRDLGVLERGQLIETDRAGMVAGYVGQTALKTRERIAEALDGILFVDEAYALVARGHGEADRFGQEAIDTLIKQMEDDRDRLVVIVAGYPAQMQEFLQSNPGLPSRFTKTIVFPSYDADELVRIVHEMAGREGLRIDPSSDESLRQYFAAARERPEFGNARSARTLLERARAAQAVRLGPLLAGGVDLVTLTRADLEAAVARSM